jgi:hypothetical protein
MSMLLVRNIFQDRADEIETYFTFIDTFTQSNKNEELNKILKSNLILMLYNLMESTISNAIEEIHNNIHSNAISFDLLKVDLRKNLIKHLKSFNPHDFVTSINNISLDIVKKSFNKQKIFNGNVDSRKIRELGGVYGFSSTTTYINTKNGQCLVDIKGRRNDLAHGIFSFTEVGKEYSLQDLEKMKNETKNYLLEILNNIDSYLSQQEYKESVIGASI